MKPAAFEYHRPASVEEAVALLADVQVPAQPRTTFSVGRVGGGASVNAIPADAWMEVDLRSVDPAALETVVRTMRDDNFVQAANAGYDLTPLRSYLR